MLKEDQIVLNENVNKLEDVIKDLESKIHEQHDGYEKLQQQINQIQRDSQLQPLFNQLTFQITDEQNKEKQKISALANQLKNSAKKTSLKEFNQINNCQLYLLQMLLNTYNNHQTFDNYNDNYKALVKPQYVQQTFAKLQSDLTDNQFTSALTNINLNQFQLAVKQKLIDVWEKCTVEELHKETNNQYIDTIISLGEHLYNFAIGDNDNLKSLIEKRNDVEQKLKEQNKVLSNLSEQIKQMKQTEVNLQKELINVQQQLQQAISSKEQAQVRTSLCDELTPRINIAMTDIKITLQGFRQCLNLKHWTSMFITLYIMLGPEQAMKIYQQINPTDGDICLVCQKLQLECCQICQNCKCLCTCQYEYDEYKQKRLLNTPAQKVKVNHFFQNVPAVVQFLQSMTMVPNNVSLFADFITSQDNIDVLELNSILLFNDCFKHSAKILSAKNYENIIQIINATNESQETIIQCYGKTATELEDQIVTLMQRQKLVNVVFIADHLTVEVVIMLTKLANINHNIEMKNTQQTVQLGSNMFKISEIPTMLNYFLVITSETTDIKYQTPRIVNSYAATKNSYFVTLNQIVLNQKHEGADETKAAEERKQLYKQKLINLISRALKPQLFKEYSQILKDITYQTSVKIKLMQELYQLIKDLTKETIITLLQSIKQNSDDLENIGKTLKNLLQQQQQLREQVQQTVSSDEIKVNMHVYQTIVAQLSRFVTYYPQLIKIMKQEVFFAQKFEARTTDEQQLQPILQDNKLVDRLQTVFCLMQSKLYYEISQPILDQLIVFLFFVWSITLDQITEKDYQFIIYCFGNIKKQNIREIFKQFDSPFCQNLEGWASQYTQEFNTIISQPNMVRYIKDYYKVQLLPECLQNLTPKIICMLFAIQVVCNVEQPLHVQCHQLIKTCVCGRYMDKVLTFKDVLQYVQQRNQIDDEVKNNKINTIIIMTQQAKIVQQLVKQHLNVDIHIIQSIKQIKRDSKLTVYVIQNQFQDRYDQEFIDYYHRYQDNVMLICADQFQYEIEDEAFDTDVQGYEAQIQQNEFYEHICQTIIHALPSVVTNYNKTYHDANVKMKHLYRYYRNKLFLMWQQRPNINVLQSSLDEYLTALKKTKNVNILQFIKQLTQQLLQIQHLLITADSFQPLHDSQLLYQISTNKNTLSGTSILVKDQFNINNNFTKNILVRLQYNATFTPLQMVPIYSIQTPFNYISFQSLIRQPKMNQTIFDWIQLSEQFYIDDKRDDEKCVKCVLDGKIVYLKRGNGGRHSVWLKQNSICFEVGSTIPSNGYCQEDELV